MKSDDNPDKTDENHDPSGSSKSLPQSKFPAGLLWVICLGLILSLILIAIGYFHPNMSERVKFVTANLLSLFILAAVVVQAYIYRKQWEAMQEQLKAMREQADIAKRALELSERADVLIDKFKVYGAPPLVRNSLFLVRLKNFGRTRAINMGTQAHITLADDFQMPDQYGGPIPLAAGTTVRIGPLRCEFFSETTIQRINQGDATLHVYVGVKYQDVFGHLHHTVQGGTYDPAHGTFNIRSIDSD